MKTWTMDRNGHTLTIKMDDEELLKFWNREVEAWKSATEPDKESMTHEDYDDMASDRAAVGCCEGYYVPIDECISECEAMVECIKKMMNENDPGVIFDMMSYKKNGTFKRTVKPIIRELSFGPYYEDSYGWHVCCIRLEAENDVTAHIVTTSYIHKY